MGAIQLGLGALMSIVTGHFVTLWPHALIAVMLGCVLLGWASLSIPRLVKK
jgi:hypothetical protein